jgi:hypothetical protein
MAKRRNRMLKADDAMYKARRQLSDMRELVKLEKAIDLLPDFNKPHKW